MSDDLNRRFSQDFRVVGETSPATGLAMLRRLADAREAVALLIADNDMAEMPGVDFFGHAHEMHPLAKRVLLVERDYSARSPLVDAMTLGQADYHITETLDAGAGSVPASQRVLGGVGEGPGGRLRTLPHRRRRRRPQHS